MKTKKRGSVAGFTGSVLFLGTILMSTSAVSAAETSKGVETPESTFCGKFPCAPGCGRTFCQCYGGAPGCASTN